MLKGSKVIINYIRPQDIKRYPTKYDEPDSKTTKYKQVGFVVPRTFSDSCYCSFIVLSDHVSAMKPSKGGKPVWKSVFLRRYREDENGELVPNMIRVRIFKEGMNKVVLVSANELRNLHMKTLGFVTEKNTVGSQSEGTETE